MKKQRGENKKDLLAMDGIAIVDLCFNGEAIDMSLLFKEHRQNIPRWILRLSHVTTNMPHYSRETIIYCLSKELFLDSNCLY